MKFFSKDSLIFYALIIFVLIIVYFVINIFNYFDITNLCYIKTEGDLVRGNEKTIKQALKYLKKNKKNDYKMVCKYANVISEKYCILADDDIDPELLREGWSLPGCYVKGSKNIYLTPSQENDEEAIREKAEAIVKYSNFSKEFWNK